MKTRVLMVCLGNICRSPIAEGILRDRVQKEGLGIETDSAGTSSFHVGEKPDSRMRAAALKNGIDISDLRARQFVVSDFDEFDIIYAMDRSNYNNIIALARNAEDEAKVRMILNESNPGMNYEVPDPYYGGDQGFQDVIDMLNDAMDVVIQKING